MKTHRGNFLSNILFLNKSGLLKKQAKILEIGSGSGALVHFLKRKGYNIKGSEIDLNYIALAKKRFGLTLRKMSGDRLAFKNRSHDLVLSFDVFEHIKDSDTHLSEVYRVLKKGGYYLFATPNKFTNIPFSILKDKHLTRWRTYHCSLHTYNQLKNRLEAHKFEVIFCDIPVVNDFFVDKLKKLLGPLGPLALHIFNPDTLPLPLRTNFFVIARKY